MTETLPLAQRMIQDATDFYRFGWMPGTSGNLSTRLTADTFLITASGKDKGRLTTDDFLVCDLDGSPVGQSSERPSAETLIHAVIYRTFAQAGACYHVHHLFTALCSDRDEHQAYTEFRGYEMIKGLDIWEEDAVVRVPIVDNPADIPTLAQKIAETLEDHDPRIPGVNIARHGIYAWGQDPFAAKRHIETFGYLFEASYRSR